MASGYSGQKAAAPDLAARSAMIAPREEPPLTYEELTRRVTLGSPALLKELYDIAQRQIVTETGRQTRLDAKATSLLTVAGLALTVAFTFGGQIILAHRNDSAPMPRFPMWALYAYGAGVLLGLLAAAFAVWALMVRGQYRQINEYAVFDRGALKEADDGHDPSTDGSDAVGLAEYHKALIPHLWEIVQQHARVHEHKAQIVKVGQMLFMAFLLSLFVVFLSLFWTIL